MWKSANFKEISLKFYELTTLPHTFAHFFSLLDPTMSMKVFSWKSFTEVFGRKRLFAKNLDLKGEKKEALTFRLQINVSRKYTKHLFYRTPLTYLIGKKKVG